MAAVVIGTSAEGRGFDVDVISQEEVGGAGKERQPGRGAGEPRWASGVGLQRDDGDSGCRPGPASGSHAHLEATTG